ncbi:MAG: T9SS type A sorting domain-containing protein [Chitinophagaceae bacterium]|nr:T9SS type A sorting domain-containing protein [Chitinophagaceae bacterium]
MRSTLILLSTFLLSFMANAQQKNNTAQFTGPFTTSIISSTDFHNLSRPHWNISLQSLCEEKEELGEAFQIKLLKELKRKQKLDLIQETSNPFSQKTTASNPSIGTNFRGNDLKTWTPTDNSIAVSNGGKIVSCINYGIDYYDTAGNILLQNHTWDAFINNASLNQAKFDPRVIYDPLHDRFIVVLLHGFSSTTSKILVCYSKTNNPVDGWNIYQLPGNPYGDQSWTDYPTIGINDEDLFINGNRFGDAPDYNYKQTYIYQIGLNEGYQGNALQYGLWNNIYAPDGTEGITLYPASHGQGKSLSGKMYFTYLRPDSGSNVYLFEINGSLQSSTHSMSATQYPIPHYEVCGDAYQKDPTTGNIDSLSTGSAWVQNSFYLNRQIHFTFDADIGSGWCGIHYGRILLDSNMAYVSAIGEIGTDLAYPAVSSFGYDEYDAGAAIAYVRSDTGMTPETGVVSIDKDWIWSGLQTVKAGDTVVNILYPPDYGVSPERWGDYTGVCRKFNSPVPQVWMAGAYGANTPPRNASYGTWIAQIISNEPNFVPTDLTSTSNIQLYPNPVDNQFTIEFENEKYGWVNISLLDMNGQIVRVLFEDQLSKSMNRLSFNKDMLLSGNFIIRVTRDQQLLKTIKLSVN